MNMEHFQICFRKFVIKLRASYLLGGTLQTSTSPRNSYTFSSMKDLYIFVGFIPRHHISWWYFKWYLFWCCIFQEPLDLYLWTFLCLTFRVVPNEWFCVLLPEPGALLIWGRMAGLSSSWNSDCSHFLAFEEEFRDFSIFPQSPRETHGSIW